MFIKCEPPDIDESKYPEFASKVEVNKEWWMKYNDYYACLQEYKGIVWCSIIRLGKRMCALTAITKSIDKLLKEHEFIGFCWTDKYRSQQLIYRLLKNKNIKVVKGWYDRDNNKHYVVFTRRVEDE